ncbi:hypothetical protein LPJ59_000205 [Coemansia sp. RSA 2399]|nr:hypothetical protein LPJ59_000205 [Coemansia sp. RSA 2399]KAJ1908316.1 hypothetical protein LPJ81_000176 [Coemansia sp. IMI 209127]
MDNKNDNSYPPEKQDRFSDSDNMPSMKSDPAALMSFEQPDYNNGQEDEGERGLFSSSHSRPQQQQQQQYPPASYSQSGPPGGGYQQQQGGYPQQQGGGYPQQQGGYPQQQGGGYPQQQGGYPQQQGGYPQQQGGYPQQQGGGYPQQQGGVAPPPSSISIPLINPKSIPSGFTQSMPEGLYMLARRPNTIKKDKWSEFIRQLNEQLSKAPGSVTQGITDHWIVNLVTLGVAGMTRDMYKSRVQSKSMELVESYNRAEFSEWGIRVLLDAIDTTGDHQLDDSNKGGLYGSRRRLDRHERHMERKAERMGAPSASITLVLVISRSE